MIPSPPQKHVATPFQMFILINPGICPLFWRARIITGKTNNRCFYIHICILYIYIYIRVRLLGYTLVPWILLWVIRRLSGPFEGFGKRIGASRSLYGASGIYKTGLGCQQKYPRSVFIDLTNIVKCKCAVCMNSEKFP